MTKARKHENTDGTSDIGDYVNSILDEHQLLQFSTINKAFSYLSVTLELSYSFEAGANAPAAPVLKRALFMITLCLSK